jgi:hypothetical protein
VLAAVATLEGEEVFAMAFIERAALADEDHRTC